MNAPRQAAADEIIARFEQRAGRPLRAMIEVSDRCNEVCVHCYQEQGLKGEMTTEQVKRVIDDLAHLGVLILTFSGGEATLRSDLLELIGHARERGFAVRLFTNGLTMTATLARSLAELAVQLVEISLYSHRAEVHEFVTGVPGSFEKTVAGIRHLVAEGVDVHIKTNVMSVNEHELAEYAALARELGATFAMSATPLMPREASDRAPQAMDRAEGTYRRVMADPSLTRSVPRGIRPEKPLSAALCGAGQSIVVEPNGEIRPCTMLHVDLGDAARGELRELTAGERHAQLTSLRWGDVHGCRACDLRSYCTRCHARGLAEVGDALAPYPTACAQARVKYEIAMGTALRIESADGPEAAMGPYRRIADDVFEALPDEITTADDALARRLGWVRRPGGALPASAVSARPGALVQLRRPGRSRGRTERVPQLPAATALDSAAIAPHRTL